MKLPALLDICSHDAQKTVIQALGVAGMDKWFTPVNLDTFKQKGVNKLIYNYLRKVYSASSPYVKKYNLCNGIGFVTGLFHIVDIGLLSIVKRVTE